MNQEKNSRPDALNNQAPNREAAPQSAPAGEEPVRGGRRSRRSTSAPTRLRQAAELLHSAPAASPASEAAASRKPAGQDSEASKHEAAGADTGTNGNLQAGTPSPRAGSGILPRTATEDDPRVWGDTPEDTSAWLREQRPPHWG